MDMTRKSLILVSALLLATACGDDSGDGDDKTDEGGDKGKNDASVDATVLRDATADANRPGNNANDGGTGDDLDANVTDGMDATTQPEAGPGDSSTPSDANTNPSTPADAALDAAADAARDSGGPPVNMNAPAALIGTWASSAGEDEVITQSAWKGGTLVQVDEAARFAIVRSGTPATYGKVVWTTPANETFNYCIVDSGLATQEAALNTTKTANPNDPTNSGCGNTRWTTLQKPIEIAGTWKLDGTDIPITSYDVGTFAVASYDNATNSAVLIDAETAAPATTYNKVVWDQPSNPTRLYVCVVDSKATEAEAKAVSISGVTLGNYTTGCNGGEWSYQLTK